MLGARVVNTIDPENIKTVLATKFDDFALGSRREDAFTPLIGHGIFTADGAAWKRSRGLIRPNFANDKVTTFAMLEKHVSNFLDNIPGNGTLVDLGALFHRFTADTATEFLFGHSLHSLSPQGKRKDNAKQDFAGAFRRGQRAIANNFALGMFARLVPSLQFNRDRDCVHDFVDHCIKQGLEAAPEDKDMMERPPENDRSSHRYTFLTELAKNESDPEVLRGELLHILVAGRDTTASLLSNLWFVLARTPRVLNKLRQEIALLEGRRPSLEEVNEMGYLKRCVSESLRLHPPIPVNNRTATRDTILPRGGGIDGDELLFLPAGTVVGFHTYSLHRLKDIYGADAEDFRPERWEDVRPGWAYLPFSGGPRVCLGQRFALTQAAYLTVRLLQEFPKVDVDQYRPWRELLTLVRFPYDVKSGMLARVL